MKTLLKRSAARMRRWLFGRSERATAAEILATQVPVEPATSNTPDSPSVPAVREVTLKVSPYTTAEELRKQISEATGVPIENVALLPIRVHPCTCPNCVAKQKRLQILRPHPN